MRINNFKQRKKIRKYRISLDDSSADRIFVDSTDGERISMQIKFQLRISIECI